MPSSRRRCLKEREQQAALQADKDRLDVFLGKTIEIERKLMRVADPQTLSGYLDQVTAIKLQALDELTHESLRGDATFVIFLQQCGDVIRRIQARLQIAVAAHDPPSTSNKMEPDDAPQLS